MTTRLYRSAIFVGGATALATLWLVLAVPGADDPTKAGRIRASDRLYVHAVNVFPNDPIKGVYLVEPSGKLPLGFAYDRVDVGGLTAEEAQDRIEKHLATWCREPRVWLTWYDPAVHGEPALQDRVAKLERELAELRNTVENLRKR